MTEDEFRTGKIVKAAPPQMSAAELANMLRVGDQVTRLGLTLTDTEARVQRAAVEIQKAHPTWPNDACLALAYMAADIVSFDMIGQATLPEGWSLHANQDGIAVTHDDGSMACLMTDEDGARMIVLRGFLTALHALTERVAVPAPTDGTVTMLESRDMPLCITGVAIRVNGRVHSQTAPARHNNLIHALAGAGYAADELCDQGFITSAGCFVDRVEALAIAKAAGQLIRNTEPQIELFFEDLW